MSGMSRIGGVVLMLTVLLTGCTAAMDHAARAESEPEISAGQKVDVSYTCRFEAGGPVVATTSREVASDEGYIKSALFSPPRKPGPITFQAGVQNATGIAARKFVLNLEEYIIEALAKKIVGMPIKDSTRTVTLTIEPQTRIPQNERILQLATVRKRPHNVTVNREYFEARYPVKAEKGNPVPIFKDELDCEITEVKEETVSYACTPLGTDGTLMTEFGPATFEKTEQGWDMILHPEKGDLIRTARMIGRITDVGPRAFTIDYTKPFGGRELICDIALSKPKRAADAGGRTADKRKPFQTGVQPAGKTADSISADSGSRKNVTEPDVAAQGDLVQVDYTATLEDGRLVSTTRREIAGDERLEKAVSFNKSSGFGPEMVIAGKEAGFPGVGQAVLGMRVGEAKQVTLSAREAYGEMSRHKVVEIPRVKSYQKNVHIRAKDYMKRFDSFPAAGKVVDVNPYLVGTIAAVQENAVLIDLRPKKKKFAEAFGEVRVEETDDTIEIVLDPRLDAEFKQDKHTGRIVSVDEDGFKVNFNHPLAGKGVALDLQVTGVTKKAALQDQKLDWLESYSTGLEAAEEQEKPMVLVLYSETCGWCEKLINETMTDPRVTRLKDTYVWVKTDGNENQDLAEKYDLKGFPLTVLLSPDGKVIERLNGFKNPADMSRELDAALGWDMAKG